ncbi:MAG TPA: adenylate/guanylate cyclase domain-containing protein [Gaiellaceae bacterium]|nr:adenylate/guanylate cyclase domain-containing protein [Gaiellaceae bacterium]
MNAENAAELTRQLGTLREQQQAVAAVLRAVAHSESLEDVFSAVLDAAMRLCNGDFGAFYLKDGEVLRTAVQNGGSPEHTSYEMTHPHAVDRRTMAGRVALTRSPVHIPDVLEDPEYSWPGREMSDYRTAMGVPILLDEELIGVIGMIRYEARPFADEEIELVGTFADQAAIAIANARLLDAVERQRAELSRFVSTPIADLVTSPQGEQLLAGHRAYITCLFCDLRGFTTFVEIAEPEEHFEVLRAYHGLLGELITTYGGTLEHFAGDGLMIFFNDPVTLPEHELQAIRLALEAQERFTELAADWRKRGTDLALGVGIAAGHATLGRIGFEGRYDYGVLGPVANLASRLSATAGPGQILVSQRLFAVVEDKVEARTVGEIELKGFTRPIEAHEILGLR